MPNGYDLIIMAHACLLVTNLTSLACHISTRPATSRALNLCGKLGEIILLKDMCTRRENGLKFKRWDDTR
jgi:hypothetical protein